MNMHKRASIFALLGDEGAVEWLRGHGDAVLGKHQAAESDQYRRGALWADMVAANRELDSRIARFQNQTRYIFEDDPLQE